MKSKSLFAIKQPAVKADTTQIKDSVSSISALIKRRRRQILVHSFIYYELNQNLISDTQWSEWATELENLQSKYPDIADKTEYADIFQGFDHSTGANLKSAYEQDSIVSIAFRLLHYNP